MLHTISVNTTAEYGIHCCLFVKKYGNFFLLVPPVPTFESDSEVVKTNVSRDKVAMYIDHVCQI